MEYLNWYILVISYLEWWFKSIYFYLYASRYEWFIVSGNCVDSNQHCASWAQKGECSSNPAYMLKSCRKSCNQCGKFIDQFLFFMIHEFHINYFDNENPNCWIFQVGRTIAEIRTHIAHHGLILVNAKKIRITCRQIARNHAINVVLV